MKKLKNKVFFTIFGILITFTFAILLVSNIQDYSREKTRVEQTLNNTFRIPIKPNNANNDNMRFFDSTAYTVILEKGSVKTIINHSRDKETNSDLNDEINKILTEKDSSYIGNLYFNKYSYNYTNDKIIIVDNTRTNTTLLTTLRNSIIIFILAGVVSAFIASKLSSWMIKPVEETFQKQKDFIADASHELKTPLAVIMASADALEKNKEKKYITNIQNESERMNKLITSLLDLSKIENNNVFEMINLSKLTEKSILTLESLMYESNIKLEYDIKDNIEFNCNSDDIKQLLSILLDNAIKHSSKNGKIIVNLSEEKNNILLDVKNKGEAIEEGEEEKIFERFYRADKSRNRNENRYGLGLAIAKSIVTKHNCEISAKSKDGFTTFKVVFKKK